MRTGLKSETYAHFQTLRDCFFLSFTHGLSALAAEESFQETNLAEQEFQAEEPSEPYDNEALRQRFEALSQNLGGMAHPPSFRGFRMPEPPALGSKTLSFGSVPLENDGREEGAWDRGES